MSHPAKKRRTATGNPRKPVAKANIHAIPSVPLQAQGRQTERPIPNVTRNTPNIKIPMI
jgi:hypothetical protein